MSELSWWFAPHPDWEPTEDWPEEVPVVRYETDDEVALIDPVQWQAHDRCLLAPERRAEATRQALDLVFTELRELG